MSRRASRFIGVETRLTRFSHAGDHVDILGRASLSEYILKVAAGKGESIKENFVSNIREYAERIKIY